MASGPTSGTTPPAPRGLLARFRRAESGVAAVEFGLLSSVLLLLFAGSFDIGYMIMSRRDAERASMLIARAVTSCPSSGCMPVVAYSYVKRVANALVRSPDAVVDIYVISRQSDQIKTCSGTQKTLTDADVIASAKNILRNNDVGVAVVLTSTYTSIMPTFVMSYIGASGATYSDHTVDVFQNYASTGDAKAICTNS